MDTKKLLYSVRYPLYEGFHLKQKFDGQLKAFENLGFEVYYIGFDKQYFYLINGENKEIIGKTHFWIPNYFHTFLYADYYSVAGYTLKQNKMDYVYFRDCAVFPSAVSFAKQINKQSIQLIYEVPTYLATAKEKSMSIMRSVYSCISEAWSKELRKVVSLYLLIGDQAPDTYCGKPAMNISNGVSLELMPKRNPIKDENCIHLLALSSMCYWHGYDRLIRSLAEYKGMMPVKIHLVGGNDGGYMEEWKALSIRLNVGDNVIFHGEQYGKDLDRLYDLCDLGIGGLGEYRQGGRNSSALKTREYMARGLPAVYTQKDKAFSSLDPDLQLWISDDESIPDMGKIVEFAEQKRRDSSCVQRLRDYAQEHLSWENEYKKIIDIL